LSAKQNERDEEPETNGHNGEKVEDINVGGSARLVLSYIPVQEYHIWLVRDDISSVGEEISI
jgi:hypothetical protein